MYDFYSYLFIIDDLVKNVIDWDEENSPNIFEKPPRSKQRHQSQSPSKYIKPTQNCLDQTITHR